MEVSSAKTGSKSGHMRRGSRLNVRVPVIQPFTHMCRVLPLEAGRCLRNAAVVTGGSRGLTQRSEHTYDRTVAGNRGR